MGEREGEGAREGWPSKSKRWSRREEDDTRARGGPAASQSGVLPAPTILRREAKQTPVRPSRQGSPADPTSGAVASVDGTCPPPQVGGQSISN